MFKNVIFASFGLVMFSLPAAADTAPPTPDVIGCLKAIETLDARYRDWMKPQCVGVAGDICIAVDDEKGHCLSDLVASLRAFYRDVSPLLPATIEGSVFTVKLYERALERAAEDFEEAPECADLQAYAFTTCEYMRLGATTMDLFDRARQAGIALP